MNMKDFSLEGKIAWITGASYGIGFAIAEAYAAAARPSYLTISTRSWLTRAWPPMPKRAFPPTAMCAT